MDFWFKVWIIAKLNWTPQRRPVQLDETSSAATPSIVGGIGSLLFHVFSLLGGV